jgi:hypothetical protein
MERIVLGILMLWFGYRFYRRLRARFRPEEAFDLRAHFEYEFRQYRIDSDDPLQRFNGATVTMVCDNDDTAWVNNQQVLLGIERYARNEAGEYFLFFSNGRGKPFCKHVSHTAARLVLKDQYVEPGNPIPER